MYVLRLISGVLHQDVGSAVSDAARDLVPAELAILVPLVACLLALSVWPAAISEHSFPAQSARSSTPVRFQPPRTPAVPHGSMSTEGGIVP
jgi:NADH:ubiquinone oxidoreductase subunit 4 (subunit M)